MGNVNVKEATFRHATLKAPSYEIGRKEADLLQKYYPEEVEFFFKGSPFIKPAPKDSIKKTIKLFDQYCPNIIEEINGFADYFGHPAEEVIYYSFSCVSKGNCGQFAVLPQKTADKKIYVGRSYEWSEDDDKRLLTVKADGLYGHMGFGMLLFGRYDGINEKGLCVTMTNGIPCVTPEEEGLRFWAVIRILLDRCKDVDEAIQLLESIPISSYCILLITDKNGQSALAEICSDVKCYKRISSTSAEGYLCSTNHYTLPEMQHLVRNRMRQSVDRYNAIRESLNAGTVDKEAMRSILSQKMPNGLACHYYHDGLGTLWSILYDVSDIRADICFGSPQANAWHSFDLNSPEGVAEYKAILPDEDSTMETWSQV
jgi:predicted choloylglycine hydrolase